MTPERMDAVEQELAELRRENAALRAVVDESVHVLRSVTDRVDRGDARDDEIRAVVSALDTAVHRDYAGGAGIGPRILTNEAGDAITRRDVDRLQAAQDFPVSGPKDPISQLWETILTGAKAPFKAFLDARTSTQLILAIAGVVAYLLFTGQLVPIIEALRGPGVEITVEGSTDGREGGSVTTDDVDAETVDLEAGTVNMGRTPEGP